MTQIAFFVAVCGSIMKIVQDLADGFKIRSGVIRRYHHGK
jgi:hypothetical protein